MRRLGAADLGDRWHDHACQQATADDVVLGGVSDVDALQRYLGAAAEQPSTTPAATRADKPFWPTALEEVLRTRAFRGEAALKLEQRLRKLSRRSRHDTHPCSSDTAE